MPFLLTFPFAGERLLCREAPRTRLQMEQHTPWGPQLILTSFVNHYFHFQGRDTNFRLKIQHTPQVLLHLKCPLQFHEFPESFPFTNF